MKKVYLIRHAQPILSGENILGMGIRDIPLGEEGRQQARKMAAQLPPVCRVFSSPLRRAVQTAHAIGQPVTLLRDLQEIQPGEQSSLSRFRAAMEQCAVEESGDFAVVSHGVIISQFLQLLTGSPRRPGYAEVITLLWENGTFYVPEK